MRSIQLPSHLALCSKPCRHWLVSAGDHSDSYHHFCNSIHQIQEECGSSYSSSSLEARFRLDHLLPADWSTLLQHCRRLTSPHGSFNYSSPGDMSAVMAEGETFNKALRGEPKAVINCAFMHIVERRSGDFVPNNQIYHELQQRYIVSSGEATGEGENAMNFASLLRHLQEGEENISVSSLEDNANNDDGRDPLEDDVHAAEKTAQNIEVCFPGDPPHAAGGVDERVFTFFPHSVVMRDCIPYRSEHFVVMVNHKPIVPGHLMVVPIRCIGTIHALTPEELRDWGRVMHLTLCVLKRVAAMRRKKASGNVFGDTTSSFFSCDDDNDNDKENGFSIAIQQGMLAGQTVPHLHTHVIPFDPRGKLAGEPEDEEVQQRQPCRTGQQMCEETEMLKPYFEFLAKGGMSS